MRIHLVLCGSAADAVPADCGSSDLPEGAQLRDLIDRLEAAAPRLRGRVRYAVNQRYATPETRLHPGDEVAVIPPVSGG